MYVCMSPVCSTVPVLRNNVGRVKCQPVSGMEYLYGNVALTGICQEYCYIGSLFFSVPVVC